MHADNIALYRPIHSTTDYSILQCDISTIVTWIRTTVTIFPYNHLSAAILYYAYFKEKKSHITTPSITVNDIPLSLVSCVKYLGIQIFCMHVTCSGPLMSQAFVLRLIGLLYHQFYKHANTSILLQLHKSFLEYCSIIWDPLFIKDKETLEKVQRFSL